MDIRRRFGNKGERFAAKFLKKKGYKIIDRQFSCRYGEIDLIARDGNEIVFIEVKARRSRAFGYPEESVTEKKLEKIWKTGEVYLKEKNLLHESSRVDVIAIEEIADNVEVHHIIGV